MDPLEPQLPQGAPEQSTAYVKLEEIVALIDTLKNHLKAKDVLIDTLYEKLGEYEDIIQNLKLEVSKTKTELREVNQKHESQVAQLRAEVQREILKRTKLANDIVQLVKGVPEQGAPNQNAIYVKKN